VKQHYYKTWNTFFIILERIANAFSWGAHATGVPVQTFSLRPQVISIENRSRWTAHQDAKWICGFLREF
jgi:hypothetical protein